MQKFIPQLEKLCISFYNLKSYANKLADWQMGYDHDVIDLLSRNAILDHSQASSFYSTMVDHAWFFTNDKLPKILRVFSNANTLLFSMMKTMRKLNFLSHSF